MTVTPSFKTFALEQLARVAPAVRGKSMFGGVGIYSGELFFALLDNDTLYLKVDDSNRPDFERSGFGPFRPAGDGGETMQYYELPADLLEDTDTLAPWVRKAIEAARVKRKGKKRRES